VRLSREQSGALIQTFAAFRDVLQRRSAMP
jgi:hypothetical protein